MMLLGVEKDGDCLYSEWRLTYRVGWGNIVSAASLLFEYTENPEIIVGDASGKKNVTVENAKELALCV